MRPLFRKRSSVRRPGAESRSRLGRSFRGKGMPERAQLAAISAHPAAMVGTVCRSFEAGQAMKP
jgi:hypothetical protein